MQVAHKTTNIEYLFVFLAYIMHKFMAPNKTSDKEKKMFIALTATTNSVAEGRIAEYQFQILGTKKCQTPNPIVATLPIVIKIRGINISIFAPDR